MRVHEMYEADDRDHAQPIMTASQLRHILDGVDDEAPVYDGTEGGGLVAAFERPDGRLELFMAPNARTP